MASTYHTRIDIVERVTIRATDPVTNLPTTYEVTRSADGDEFGYGYVVFRGEENGEMAWLGDATCKGGDDEFRTLADTWIRDYHERVRLLPEVVTRASGKVAA